MSVHQIDMDKLLLPREKDLKMDWALAVVVFYHQHHLRHSFSLAAGAGNSAHADAMYGAGL